LCSHSTGTNTPGVDRVPEGYGPGMAEFPQPALAERQASTGFVVDSEVVRE
jgi:hypothetical protein